MSKKLPKKKLPLQIFIYIAPKVITITANFSALFFLKVDYTQPHLHPLIHNIYTYL